MEGVQASPSQVSAMAGALISSANDKDPAVQEIVVMSLTNLGKHQHAVVLGAIKNFLANNPKLDHNHHVILLKAMNNIVKETLPHTDINIALARDLISMVSEDMTKSKKIVADLQSAASDILVTLGTAFVNEVMEELLKKLQPGVLPHFFIVQTLGNLATANVFKMVPYLNHLLGTFLPLLGLAKADNMRWVFASCIAHFAEAIQEYVVNLDKAPDPSITKKTFANELSGAYDVLYNTWILTKEMKLRCAVADALGRISMLLDQEKLEDTAPRLTTMLVSLYKRQPNDPYPLTKALCDVISATSVLKSQVLELNLDGMVTVLHGHICAGSDTDINQSAVKNYNEVLRCFGLLATQYSEMLVNFMLQRVDWKDQRIRIGSLVVLRHLINSAPTHIEPRKDVVVIGLTRILTEQNNKVKQHLTRVISAMASHGFLVQEGGEQFVEFVVRQCAVEPPKKNEEKFLNGNNHAVSDITLQAMCDNVLYLMTTTIDGMDAVLWPFLFEFFKSEEMAPAVGVISRCLAHIAKIKRETHAPDYLINFSQSVNIPSSFGIFARLLVLLSHPRESRFLADHILDLLINLGAVVNHKLTELWDSSIPEIKIFLEDSVTSGLWSQQAWEEQITQFLSHSIEAVADDEWTCLLGVELASQLTLYNNMPEHKNFSYKCLGVLLRLSANKEFVDVSLTSLFQSIKQSELAEREGAGICLGYCASSHLDLALSKLDAFRKNQVMKKDNSLFGGFFKSDKAALEIEFMKGTAALCCGYAAYFAPPDLVPSRVDAVIVKMLLPLFKGIKDHRVKENLVYATELIATSVHPNHLTNHPVHPAEPEPETPSKKSPKKKKVSLPSRGDIVNHLLAYLKEDGLERPSAVKAAVLASLAELIKLDPQMNDADIFQMIQTCTQHVIGLPDVVEGTTEGHWPIPQKLLQEQCMVGLCSVLREVIVKCPTPTGLDSVFKHLHSWLSSEKPHERERSLKVASRVFDIYFDAFTVTKSQTSLNTMGVLMSRVLARCCDPVNPLRKEAVECVRQLLRIQNKYNGAKQAGNDEAIGTLEALGTKLSNANAQDMYETMKTVSKVVLKKMPNELTYYIDGSLTTALMNCLLDPHPTCANGACLVLHDIFKTRGTGFGKQVNQIVEGIHTTLKSVTDGTTRNGVLKLVSFLTSHHLLPTLNALLSNAIPYTESNVADNASKSKRGKESKKANTPPSDRGQIIACWRTLGADSSLRETVTEFLLNMLSRGLPYDEKHKGIIKKSKEFTRIATPQLIAASCALREVLEASNSSNNSKESQTEGKGSFHRTVAVCLVRVGSMRCVGPPPKIEVNPFRQAIDTLYCLIAATCTRQLKQFLEENFLWNNFESDDEEKFYDAIATLARGLSKYRQDDIADIVTFLNPFISSIYVPQRVTVAAFFAQLVAESAGKNEILLEVIVSGIRGRLVDPSAVVRRLCIRGLANIVGSSSDQVERYGTSVLSAMMAGMDDKHDIDDSIALESMSGLERFLNEVENTNIHSIFVNICLRVRPCFEKDNSEVRSTAIRLFGCLAKCGVGPSENAFAEQTHTNLIPILLHLNDDEPSVRRACRETLRKVGHVLGSKAVEEMFKKVLQDEAELHYGEFMNDLAKILVRDIEDKVNFYLMGCVSFFKSQWSVIRSNAAMLSGFLMSNVPEDKQASITKEHICSALIHLLKDSAPGVRSKAAEAMSVLHLY